MGVSGFIEHVRSTNSGLIYLGRRHLSGQEWPAGYARPLIYFSYFVNPARGILFNNLLVTSSRPLTELSVFPRKVAEPQVNTCTMDCFWVGPLRDYLIAIEVLHVRI